MTLKRPERKLKRPERAGSYDSSRVRATYRINYNNNIYNNKLQSCFLTVLPVLPENRCESKKDSLELRKSIGNEVTSQMSAKEFKPLHPSVKEIINYWNDVCIQGQHLCRSKVASKVFKKACKTILAVISHKHPGIKRHVSYRDFPPSIEEIKLRIDDHAKEALGFDWRPLAVNYKQKLKHLSIENFFWYGSAQIHPTSPMKSRFLFLTENPPRPVKGVIQKIVDRYPNLTEALIEIYRMKVLGAIAYIPNIVEKNKFATASLRLKDFLKHNSRRINPRFLTLMSNNKQAATLLFKAINTDMEITSEYFKPGAFCSDRTFNYRLPTYLTKENILFERALR